MKFKYHFQTEEYDKKKFNFVEVEWDTEIDNISEEDLPKKIKELHNGFNNAFHTTLLLKSLEDKSKPAFYSSGTAVITKKDKNKNSVHLNINEYERFKEVFKPSADNKNYPYKYTYEEIKSRINE